MSRVPRRSDRTCGFPRLSFYVPTSILKTCEGALTVFTLKSVSDVSASVATTVATTRVIETRAG
jgi:hypothetical protein